VQITYDATKLPFGRVTGASLLPAGGAPPVAIDFKDATKCYKVVTTLYVANLLGLIKALTNGALSVVAKDKDCTTDISASLAAHVITTPAGELKNWQSLVKYVSSLPDTDADVVPNLPAALYMADHGNYKKAP